MKTKQDYEYNLTEMKLTHSFALKMATIICWSVVSIVFGLGIFFGDKTPLTLGAIAVVGIVLGIITFTRTRSACI